MKCTYLNCKEPPVKRLQQSSGGRPWFGCEAHYPAMSSALLIGLSGAQSGTGWVDVTDVK